jgi:hypothetical protein
MNIVKSLRRISKGEYVLPEPNINYYVVKDKKFIFTNYKTAGTYNTQIQDVPNELSLILDIYIDSRPPHDSLRSSPPRGVGDPTPDDMPLFVNYKGKAIRENYNITKHLNSIFDDKKISVDMLRNIYLTTNFKENLTNLKETATAMGTSPDVIQNHYVKLDSPPTPLKEEIPTTEPKSKNIKINKITKLKEEIPTTEPKSKNIKINKITKLKEEIPPTEIINKNLTINRSKSQATPTPEEEDDEQPRTSKKSKIQRRIIEDDEDTEPEPLKLTKSNVLKLEHPKDDNFVWAEDEDNSTNTDSDYESRVDDSEDSSYPHKRWPRIVIPPKIFPRKDVALVTKLFNEMSYASSRYRVSRGSDRVEAQKDMDEVEAELLPLLKTINAGHILAYLDRGEKPPQEEFVPPTYSKKVIEKVRKLWNKFNDIDTEKYPEETEKIYEQLENIDDAFVMTAYFDEGEEPPVTNEHPQEYLYAGLPTSSRDTTFTTFNERTFNKLTSKQSTKFFSLKTKNERKKYLERIGNAGTRMTKKDKEIQEALKKQKQKDADKKEQEEYEAEQALMSNMSRGERWTYNKQKMEALQSVAKMYNIK